MTITRAQVADLQPGDVVEISDAQWPEGTVVRGPLWLNGDTLHCAGEYVRHYDGSAPRGGATQTLTVVSRAPRPLYVNHPRVEPRSGDVVRAADDESDPRTWTRNVPGFSHEWHANAANMYVPREKLPTRLRLLVDGETGLVVLP